MKSVMFRLGLASVVAVLITAAVAPSMAADLAAAKQNYQTFCVKCHGPDGKGDGPSAAALKTKPRNFHECTRMHAITDPTLFNVIKNGGAANGLSADMPPWKQGFEDDEIHGLVEYVRTFCKK